MKKFLQRLKKDERGLTLVELLAVVVILAIVGAIAFVAIGNVIDNSKKDAHVANAQQLISAAKLYESSVGKFPTGGLDTSVTADTASDTKPFFNTIDTLKDPWGGSSYTGIVTKKGDDYTVSITGGNSSCSLTNVPESEINQGREEACNYNAPTAG